MDDRTNRLLIGLAVAGGNGNERLSVRLESVRLTAGDRVVALVADRLITIDRRVASSVSFVVDVPAGRYDGLALDLSGLTVDPPIGASRTAEIRGSVSARAAFDLAVGSVGRLAIAFDLNALEATGRLDTAVMVEAASTRQSARLRLGQETPARLSLGDSKLDLGRLPAVLAIPLGAFPVDTEVEVAWGEGEALPSLLRGQRRLGDVVEVHASVQPDAPIEITVPYDNVAATAAGYRVDELMVLELDDRRTRYRELRPVRIDPAAHTLTARTKSTSLFFAGTPGVRIDQPELVRTAGGEAVHYTGGDRTTLSGQATDPRARVKLRGVQADEQWSNLGWFVLERVPLGAAETRLELEAQVDGLLSHMFELSVRRSPPVKQITNVNRLYGPEVVFAGTIPFASGVVVQDWRVGEMGAPEPEFWINGFARNGPYLYWPEGSAWQWQGPRLLEDWFTENEAAVVVIRSFEATFHERVPIDTAVDPRFRHVLAVRDLVPRVRGDLFRALGLAGAVFAVQQLFGPGNLTVSPTVPLAAFGEGEVGVAYVAATADGFRAIGQDSMDVVLERFYAPRHAGSSRILAGALHFVRATRREVLARELVAPDLNVWCANLVLRRHPITGEPAILGLALADPPRRFSDNVPGVSQLVLFLRQPDGIWRREIVLDGQPVVDADFVFDAEGQPRVVAATAGHDPLKAHLVYIERGPAGWTASPIRWNQEGFPENTDWGVWPRLAITDQGRAVVAFVYAAQAVFWFLAVQEDEAWRVARVGSADHADLFGADAVSRDQAFERDPVGASRTSFAHFAPSIAMQGERLWYAYGGGVLYLAEIDPETLLVTTHAVDVDRTTGLFPAVTTRPGGQVAIVYKDQWGSGQFLPNRQGLFGRDDLHFWSADPGVFVPGQAPSTRRFPAGQLQDYISLMGWTERRAVTCDALFDSFEDVMRSLLQHASISLAYYPGGEGRPFPRELRMATSHHSLVRFLEDRSNRPDVMELVIDNGASGDPVRSLTLTAVTNLFSVADADQSLQNALNAGVVPTALRQAFATNGVSFTSSPHVMPFRQGASGSGLELVSAGQPAELWDVIDPALRLNRIARRAYRVRPNGANLDVSVAPVLTIDAEDAERDDLGRPIPCGQSQDDWDVVSSFFGDLLSDVQALPDRVRFARIIEASDIRVRYGDAEPSRLQQGAVAFTIELADLRLEGSIEDGGDLVEVTAYSLGPSTFRFTLAPFVRNQALEWHVRDLTVRRAEFEIDVDLGILPWLGVIVGLLTGQGWLVALSAAADPVAETAANSFEDEPFELPFSGAQGLVRGIFEGFVRRMLNERGSPTLDAVFLTRRLLTYWTRGELATSMLPVTAVDLFPPGRSLGRATIGAPPARAVLLLMNSGGLPVSLEAVRIVGSPAFRQPRPTAPRIIAPGASEAIAVEFVARAPAGIHDAEIEITFNGGRTLHQRLFVIDAALAATLPAGSISDGLRSAFQNNGVWLAPAVAVEAGALGTAEWLIRELTGSMRRFLARVEAEGLVIYGGFHLSAIADPRPAPDIRVIPPQWHRFGLVRMGASARLPVVILNEGDATLAVRRVRIEPDPVLDDRFMLSGPTGPFRVPARLLQRLDVTFSPETATAHRAILVIESDDPDQPEVHVVLTGHGYAATIEVRPTEIRFNPWPMGSSRPADLPREVFFGHVRGIDIYNLGTAPLTIAGSSFTAHDTSGAVSPHFTLLDAGGQPFPMQDLAIAPGTAHALRVGFHAVAVGHHEATIEIRSDDPFDPVVEVRLSGQGS